MKIPSGLSKGLTEEQQNSLERELKSSVLAKQLRRWLRTEIANAELREEQVVVDGIGALAAQLGERRGLRRVLNTLPEE